jgi:poly(hydroxyalkanoate) depolymerase family esterase
VIKVRVLLIGVAVLASVLTATTPASAATVSEVTGFGGNPGALRMFRYVPDGLPSGRPIVVAMHGCTQDAVGYGTNTGWLALAQERQFTLVLPQQQQANNANKCFNWFQSGDIGRGMGEAESVAQMVRRTKTDTSAGQVYVTGLSAGGGMTTAMLAAYPDLFAGGGVVAGLPYRCATSLIDAFSCMYPGKNLTAGQWGDLVRSASSHTGPWPIVSVWQGTSDFTVAPANQREIVEQWTNVHGVPATPSTTDTVAGYPHATYRDQSGRSVVETYSITGMGHGQPVDPGTGTGKCGTAAPYILDVNVCSAWYISRFWGL